MRSSLRTCSSNSSTFWGCPTWQVPNLDLPPPASHPLPLATATLKQHLHTGTELVGLDRAPGPALELPPTTGRRATMKVTIYGWSTNLDMSMRRLLAAV